jgi:hypothetical protein
VGGGFGCDETNPAVDPDGPEACTDGVDNDCDGATDQFDTECGGDGCDTNNPAVDPDGPEHCFDGIDNNCDRAVDAVDTDCGGIGCDVLNPSIDPDGPEICNDGIDNDCDGAHSRDAQDRCGSDPAQVAGHDQEDHREGVPTGCGLAE